MVLCPAHQCLCAVAISVTVDFAIVVAVVVAVELMFFSTFVPFPFRCKFKYSACRSRCKSSCETVKTIKECLDSFIPLFLLPHFLLMVTPEVFSVFLPNGKLIYFIFTVLHPIPFLF